jgi:PKHD-type hydroxylase
MSVGRFDVAPLGNTQYQQVVARSLFSAGDCERIVAQLDPGDWTAAGITAEGSTAAAYDNKVRSATLQKLPCDDSWPFRELVDAIAGVNSEVYRFELSGVYDSDGPSVARYRAEETDHFRPHQDAGGAHCRRKLTYVVQLSDGDSYVGGDLLIKDGGIVGPRAQGTLIIFPSSLFHVVSPVIQGVRHALVGWIHGPTMA